MEVAINNTIKSFTERIEVDKNHRYKSWEHCYNFFGQNFKLLRNKKFDNACLNLAFFLASWGMYRGSSGLLWKDYKIHKSYLEILLEDRYEPLRNLNILEIKTLQIQNLFDLSKRIKQKIEDISYSKRSGKVDRVTATDTLVTKILLGTLGCTLAYDNYFRQGCRELNKNIENKITPFTNFNKKSYLRLTEFYKNHSKSFENASKVVEKRLQMKYPDMKLLDMYLWQIGYSSSKTT